MFERGWKFIRLEVLPKMNGLEMKHMKKIYIFLGHKGLEVSTVLGTLECTVFSRNLYKCC
jgi:hypothetical protein